MGQRLYLIGKLIRHFQYLKVAGGMLWSPGAIGENRSRDVIYACLEELKELNLDEFQEITKNAEKMREIMNKYGNEGKLSRTDGDKLTNYSQINRSLLLKFLELYNEIKPELKKESYDEEKLFTDMNYLKSLLENKEETSIKFIESSPEKRELEDIIKSMIQRLSENEEIKFTGYFDHQLIGILSEAITDKKIKIKIISPELKKTGGEDKRNLDALKRIDAKGGQIKFNDLIHARMVITEKDVLIGSADMKGNSLGGRHFEAGIYSNSIMIVKKSKDFFDNIWAESTKLGEIDEKIIPGDGIEKQ